MLTNEAEIGAVHLQAKECQGWLAAPRSQEGGKEGASSRAFRGSTALQTP